MAGEELLNRIQEALRKSGMPAWLFYGFHEIDPIAIRILQFGPDYHGTRRWFYLVPNEGPPLKLVHRIESGILDHLPGEKQIYLSWQELDSALENILEGRSEVAMQASSIPYVSKVDSGTVDRIRKCGPQVVSSENLVQLFEAVWTQDQLRGHRRSADVLTSTVRAAFEMVAERVRADAHVDECDVQDFILAGFADEGLITDSPPIVGVNENAGDPHYAPVRETCRKIQRDNLLLIDLWARSDESDSIFADITWTAYYDTSPPARVQEVFKTVVSARDRGFELLQNNYANGRATEGWEVDDAVRQVIAEEGYGDYFVHRTGHNLGSDSPHGNGVNFDNLESHDTRQVIVGVGCTIEPGIYLPDFGIRSEINIYMSADGPQITTQPQTDLLVFKV